MTEYGAFVRGINVGGDSSSAGKKGSRRADAAKVDENGNVIDVIQVYRPTPKGNVPKREVDAAKDIEAATKKIENGSRASGARNKREHPCARIAAW